MSSFIKIYRDANLLAQTLALEFIEYTHEVLQNKPKFFTALSGGSTPKLFFKELARLDKEHKVKADWKRIHFFWGDERCVPPNSSESNFGAAKQFLFDHIDIPKENIHRIRGENDPDTEANIYEIHIRKTLHAQKSIPVFDWVFLGMGEDGHTASIFPNQMELLNAEELCLVARHPASQQKRITITGALINSANRISFLVSGINKSQIVSLILKEDPLAKIYPAAAIDPINGKLEWILDSEAAKHLESE